MYQSKEMFVHNPNLMSVQLKEHIVHYTYVTAKGQTAIKNSLGTSNGKLLVEHITYCDAPIGITVSQK